MSKLKVKTESCTKNVEITQTFFSYRYENTNGFPVKVEGFRTEAKMLKHIAKHLKDYEIEK